MTGVQTCALPISYEEPDYGTCAVSDKNFDDKNRVSKSKALSPSLKQLGDNMRRERMARGMTQQQLAEFADLNIRNVQQLRPVRLTFFSAPLPESKAPSAVHGRSCFLKTGTDKTNKRDQPGLSCLF